MGKTDQQMALERVKDFPPIRPRHLFEALLATLIANLPLLRHQWPFLQTHHYEKLWQRTRQLSALWVGIF